MRQFTATQPQVEQILAGNEKIEVSNLLGVYYNDYKLPMVKELVMTWIRINKNENAETNISNILETEDSNRADVGILVGWGNQRMEILQC